MKPRFGEIEARSLRDASEIQPRWMRDESEIWRDAEVCKFSQFSNSLSKLRRILLSGEFLVLFRSSAVKGSLAPALRSPLALRPPVQIASVLQVICGLNNCALLCLFVLVVAIHLVTALLCWFLPGLTFSRSQGLPFPHHWLKPVNHFCTFSAPLFALFLEPTLAIQPLTKNTAPQVQPGV